MLEEVGEGEEIDLRLYSFFVSSGSGSCNTDCDCPLCAPFCSKWGYCQENTSNGRRKILLKDCVKKEAVTDELILA